MRKRVINSMGFGDVLNPFEWTAGTSLDCGFFAGGVFNPACWCLSFPALCPASTYVAAQALANPEMYVQPSPLPPPSAPSSATTAPDMPTQADIDASIAVAAAQGQQNFQTDIADTQANLDAAAAGQPGLFSSIPTWLWLVFGGGLILIFMMPTEPYRRGAR